MTENNKMREMPVYKLMIQMGIPMILSMALQAVYNIVDSAFVGNMKEGERGCAECAYTCVSGANAYGCNCNWNRSGNECASCKNAWTGRF